MGKLKVGVIGLGMGFTHLENYLKCADAEVVAIADRIEERRSRAKEICPGARYYTEGADMIANEKLDIISVAVPNNQHKDLTIAALKSGANVLCEKPMAMNTAEAQEMKDTADQLGLKLGIDFSYRFRPQSRAMKELVESGALGEIYYARSVWMRRRGIPGIAKGFNTKGASGSWFFDKEQSGGGPLIDLGVHRLDLVMWLMGYPEPDCVLASTYCKIAPEVAKRNNINYTVEDLACAMIKLKNGATIELDASWASNIKMNEDQSSRLLGTKGGLYQYNLNEGYEYEVEFYQDLNGKQYDCKLHPPVPGVKDAFSLFVEAVRDDTPYLVDAKDGVMVMRILDAIYESARTGKPVYF